MLRSFFLLWGILALNAGASREICPIAVLFPNSRRAPEQGIGIPGRTGFIYDTTAGYDALGPGDTLDGRSHGSYDSHRAVQRYLRRKDFQDGVLDIFVVVLRPEDSLDPAPGMEHAWGFVNFFGTATGLAGRHGPRGMRRNRDALRHVRLVVIEARSPRRSESRDTPISVLRLASDIARDFDTEVLAPMQLVDVDDNGVLETPGGWLHFSAEHAP